MHLARGEVGVEDGACPGVAQQHRLLHQVHLQESEFFIDNLLVRIHLIIEMIWWTGLALWEFESLFPCSLISTFLVNLRCIRTFI